MRLNKACRADHGIEVFLSRMELVGNTKETSSTLRIFKYNTATNSAQISVLAKNIANGATHSYVIIYLISLTIITVWLRILI